MQKIKDTFEQSYNFEQDGVVFDTALLSGMLKEDPIRDEAIRRAG